MCDVEGDVDEMQDCQAYCTHRHRCRHGQRGNVRGGQGWKSRFGRDGVFRSIQHWFVKFRWDKFEFAVSEKVWISVVFSSFRYKDTDNPLFDIIRHDRAILWWSGTRRNDLFRDSWISSLGVGLQFPINLFHCSSRSKKVCFRENQEIVNMEVQTLNQWNEYQFWETVSLQNGQNDLVIWVGSFHKNLITCRSQQIGFLGNVTVSWGFLLDYTISRKLLVVFVFSLFQMF